MRSRSKYPIQVLAAGFLVLVFLSLSLFWARWVCKSILAGIMPMDYRAVDITPSGLVPADFESDPNILRRSGAHAYIIHPEAPQTLGFMDDLAGSSPGGKHSDVYLQKYDNEAWNWIYFDRSTGRIVCRYEIKERMPDTTIMRKMVQIYVGSEGISETPDEDTGRFTSPVVDVSDIGRGQLTLYDKKLRQFFTVKFLKEVELIRGPQLPEEDPRRPVDIGLLSKNPGVLDLYWSPLTSQNPQEGVSYGRSVHIPIREGNSDYRPERYVLVLDESGRIDLLDKETLEFAGPAGRLPAPETFFPTDKNVTPDDLLAYRILPMALKEDHKYRGLFAAAVSREGTALALAVFDANGVPIKSDQTWTTVRRGNIITYSSSVVFFGAPWAPVMTIGKFLLENLHPPILSLASYFTAGSIEAASGHRAMFLLPNSFIAMKGRDARGNIATRFLAALLLILPSIVLAIFLAVRVGKDAAFVGLPQKTRSFWTLGTLAFGLTGYITYRLTRPKITLVTCANCGKPRRTDMDKCHRCGSKWDVPELIPPAWRVVNG